MSNHAKYVTKKGSYAITGCKSKDTRIKEGDIVITSGNQNLADGTEVKVNGF